MHKQKYPEEITFTYGFYTTLIEQRNNNHGELNTLSNFSVGMPEIHSLSCFSNAKQLSTVNLD